MYTQLSICIYTQVIMHDHTIGIGGDSVHVESIYKHSNLYLFTKTTPMDRITIATGTMLCIVHPACDQVTKTVLLSTQS